MFLLPPLLIKLKVIIFVVTIALISVVYEYDKTRNDIFENTNIEEKPLKTWKFGT